GPVRRGHGPGQRANPARRRGAVRAARVVPDAGGRAAGWMAPGVPRPAGRAAPAGDVGAMTPWDPRPAAAANLLNPAFVATVLASCVQAHGAARGPLPLPLAFLIAPVVLHRATREALPKSTATSLPGWLQDNAERLVGFGARARALVPFAREA